VEKFYSTFDCLKQAIQPRVVGPLYYIRWIAYWARANIGIASGTSIDYIFMCCDRGRTTCACECDPTGSHMYV